MKLALPIVTLSLALSACSSWPAHTADSTDKSAAVKARPAVSAHQAGAASSRQADADPLPDTPLTADLLYKLLTAEIAYQRGDWETGYVATLSAAEHARDPRLAKRAAEMALGAKQPQQALAAVRLWRDLAPHSDEANQYYLSFVILNGDLDEARPLLQRRLADAEPRERTVLAFQIERLLARAKDKQAAFALLQDLLAPYAGMPEAHIALAQGAHAAGDDARAQREARIALTANPESELAILTLAQATPDKQQAANELKDFTRRYPNAENVRLAYARVMIEEKNYAEARSAFQALLHQKPQDLTALYALGVLDLQTNDLDSAERNLKAYLKALAAQPDATREPTQALLLLAQIAEERDDPQAELKWLGDIQPGEAYLGAQIKRAQVLARTGDIDAARHALEQINTGGEGEEVQVAMAEGRILRDANRSQEAMAVLHAALKKYPDNTDLLYDYAMTAEKANRLRTMEHALRKVIRLAPDNQNAYNALGYTLADRNIRLKEAYSLIEKARKLAPHDPYIMDSMGWVQFRMGRLKEAEALLRRAYALRADVEIAAHLGEVLWVRGHRRDAEQFWRAAHSKDPQNDTLKSTLSRLNVSL